MKKQDNSKKMLFEAMHKVTGMPLREEFDSRFGSPSGNLNELLKKIQQFILSKNNPTYGDVMSAFEMEHSPEDIKEAINYLTTNGFISQTVDSQNDWNNVLTAKQQSGGGMSEDVGGSNGFTAITKEKNPKEFNELKNILGLEKMGSRIELPNGSSIMNQGDFQLTFSSKDFRNTEYPDPPQAGSAPDERGTNW